MQNTHTFGHRWVQVQQQTGIRQSSEQHISTAAHEYQEWQQGPSDQGMQQMGPAGKALAQGNCHRPKGSCHSFALAFLRGAAASSAGDAEAWPRAVVRRAGQQGAVHCPQAPGAQVQHPEARP